MTIYPPMRVGHSTLLGDAFESVRSVFMNADQYLFSILHREAVDTGPTSPARGVLAVLAPTIARWANRYLVGIGPSGSFAKGTANKSGTDIDIFISLKPETQESLKDLYNSLFTWMQNAGYTPKRQNVSINIRAGALDVDLVPGKQQNPFTDDHSLYRRRADTWTKTNVARHIAHVRQSQRLNEIRIIKRWRHQRGLDFPSFYLELTVIEALYGAPTANLSANVLKVLEYLRDKFETARVVDPANTNNVISDDLTAAERTAIRSAATRALNGTWGEMVS